MRTDLEKLIIGLGFTDYIAAEGIQKFTAGGYEVEFITQRPGARDIAALHVTVRPVIGSQGYDAIVFDTNGIEIEKIEITIPHDGKSEAIDAQLVVSNEGRGETIAGADCDDLVALFPHIISTCKKKAEKDYSDCVLLVVIDAMPPFQSDIDHFEELIENLVSELRDINFTAKQVVLCIAHNGRTIPITMQ